MVQDCTIFKNSHQFIANYTAYRHLIWTPSYCSQVEPLSYSNSENQSSKSYHHISLVKYSSTLFPSQYYVYFTWQVYEKCLESSIIRDWIDNLLCRFSNSGLSTQSFWFQNMNMWLLKFSINLANWRTRLKRYYT